MTRPGDGRPGRGRSIDDEPADDLVDGPDGEVLDGAPSDADGPDPEPGPDEDARPGARRSARARSEGRLDFLYRGNGGLDIVGRSRTWYAIFGAVLVVCILSMVIRGFNFGIDFEGGTSVQFPATGANGPVETSQVEQVFAETLGRPPTSVQTAGQGPTSTVLIRSERLDQGQTIALRQALFDRFRPIGSSGVPDPNAVSDSVVSASWGGEITRQALIALAVFLVLVTVYLTFYFERRMAIAALIALANDILITAGIYSLVGFEVSPATVIGLLTILGFSLYDTVVVFDKVRENTRGLLGLTRRTFAEAANLASNQTLMRSLNTSLIAALPLMGLFIVGVGLLGVGVLGDLALVQLVGTIVGAASSVLLATPIVVDLTMRDRRWQQQAQKVATRRAKAARRTAEGPTDAVDGAGTSPTGGAGDPTDMLDTREVAAAGAARGRAAGPSSSSTRGPSGGTTPRPGARPAGKSGRAGGKRRK